MLYFLKRRNLWYILARNLTELKLITWCMTFVCHSKIASTLEALPFVSRIYAIHRSSSTKIYARSTKLSSQHTKWVTSLQEYSFSIVHKTGSSNKIANALSRGYGLLSIISTYTLGLEHVPEILKDRGGCTM
jgi:hypothetical protein